jgi:hypothetical protein
MDGTAFPQTREELAALEARYRPFESAAEWSDVGVDAARWQRHAGALRESIKLADPATCDGIRERFLRAAALDSSALAELIRPAPEVTSVVLHASLGEDSWSSIVGASGLVVECHRRALAVAAEAVEAGSVVDEVLIGRLQDLIVESQQTYTVRNPDGTPASVELPRRQYKQVSNYLVRTDREIVPFAPAGRVAEEMGRLVSELDSTAFARLHPVLQSTYVHMALVHIHPFADGNGRLARTLACMPLLRTVGLPQLILADQWPAYVQALERYDEGDVRAVVRLFLAAQVNAMDLARSLLGSGELASDIPLPNAGRAERTLLDLVAIHAREAVGVPGLGRSVAVTGGTDGAAVRVAIADADGSSPTDVEFAVAPDDAAGWLRLVSSAGDVL